MGYRQGGQHGDTHVEQGQPGGGGHGENQGDQDHKPNGVEHRDPHNKTGKDHGPLDIALPELLHQFGGNPLGGAAIGNQLAQHGTQTQYQD